MHVIAIFTYLDYLLLFVKVYGLLTLTFNFISDSMTEL